MKAKFKRYIIYGQLHIPNMQNIQRNFEEVFMKTAIIIILASTFRSYRWYQRRQPLQTSANKKNFFSMRDDETIIFNFVSAKTIAPKLFAANTITFQA